MSGALRIRRVSPGTAAAGVESRPPSEYIERLVKLIPTEIIGLYLGGKAAIQTRYIDFHTPAVGAPSQDPPVLGPNEDVAWVGWTAICFFALLAVRAWATKQNEKPQWSAVLIAAISYLIWVYSFGDVFHLVMGIWDPLPATLLVLVWTFAVPVFYRGDADVPAVTRKTVAEAAAPAKAARA